MIVSAQDFASSNAKLKLGSIKNIINASDLVSKLQKTLQLLKPIDALTKYFQSDKVVLSDMYDPFIWLEADFNL